MEAYPSDYVVHNLPLVLLAGLEPNKVETPIAEITQEFLGDGGFRLRAELAPLHHPLTRELRATLLSYDGSNAPWRSRSGDKTEQGQAFKIRSVGRAYTLPPRKAPPPPHAPPLRPINGVSPQPLTLHSTLSPLSPHSPLYPDGVLTPLWITKHQHRLPSVLISFYNLVSDSKTSSLEDNKLKAEINTVRGLITSTNYRTKFVIVLVADGPINHTDLEERLVNIRRGTNFDSKALYYLPAVSTQAEITDFAKVLFATLHPICIEYYRDLSKHARRKRNRNSIPPATVPPTQGAFSVLSLQGWNVRYEFKLGMFAETRQELEAASQNFEQAYEGLFHSELLGDAIPAHSARFDEARMLADVVAIRLIRCSLWSSQLVTAVKWWTKHRDRMRDLVGRRGKGTENYGWEAWQAIWSKIMVELIERSEVFKFAASQIPPGSLPLVQIVSSKLATSIERQLPWESLHHEGYWLNTVRKHIEARRQYTILLSDGRTRKDHPPNKQGSREAPYDTYLTPEPIFERRLLEENGDNYSRRICMIIDDSVKAFQQRGQFGMVEMLQFLKCREHHRSRKWSETIASLKNTWIKGSWRNQGWWMLLFGVGEALLEAAVETNDHELCLRLIWELTTLRDRDYDSSMLHTTNPLSTALDFETTLTPLLVSFAFASNDGRVGEPVAVQLSLSSSDRIFPINLQISEIKVAFDGGISAILLTNEMANQHIHQPDEKLISTIELKESDGHFEHQPKRLSMAGASYLSGVANLTLAVKQTKVFNFEVVPREAGPVSVASIVVLLRGETYELSLNALNPTSNDAVWWELRNGQPKCRAFGMHRDVTNMNVLPKPPKLDIQLTTLRTAYYTNETLELRIEVSNDEDVKVDGHLEARLISPDSNTVDVRWKHDNIPATSREGDIKEAVLPAANIQDMPANHSETYTLMISGLTDLVDHELELKVDYVLPHNVESTLTRQLVVKLPIIRPFEATAVFMPQVHHEAWPDFFSAPATATDLPLGIIQKYLVRADIVCSAQDILVVRSMELRSRRIVGGATLVVGAGKPANNGDANTLPVDGMKLIPEKTEQVYFDLEMQKLVLGDRVPVAVDLVVDIAWSRLDSEDINTSTLVLPKFLTPMSEPRALLSISKIDGGPGMFFLTYTIENPSMHFLTFNITMEGGDGLAFSGMKSKTVSLVPISRHDVHYRVYVQKSDEWIGVRLEVLDTFFGQTLKVQPASDGVRVDKQGNIQIWAKA